MTEFTEKACIPKSCWERLHHYFGSMGTDYYDLLNESYRIARKEGTLHETKKEVVYPLRMKTEQQKIIQVRYVPNPVRQNNPDWIWCLREVEEIDERSPRKTKKKLSKAKGRAKAAQPAKTKGIKADDPGAEQARIVRALYSKKDAKSQVNAEENTKKKDSANKKKETKQNNEAESHLRVRTESTGGTPLRYQNRERNDAVEVVRTKSEEPSDIEPNEALKQFAWLGKESEFYIDLHNIMMTEGWYFDPFNAYVSLASYINYTFYRLQTEDKIVQSIDGEYAAFNTGLVDARYNEIFALFERTTDYRQEWKYRAFCIRGTGDGKILSERFADFPLRADYAIDERLRQIGKDTELDVDFRHIVITNAGRLPEDLLIDECDNRTKNALKKVLAQRKRCEESADREGMAQQNERLGTFVAQDESYQNRLLDRLEEHIKIAQSRVEQNPAIAIPVYYPGKNTMSVMLPLYRNREEIYAYGALVVGITPAGNYQAHTILTPRMAYVDARIVQPIDSLWLMRAYTQAPL